MSPLVFFSAAAMAAAISARSWSVSISPPARGPAAAERAATAREAAAPAPAAAAAAPTATSAAAAAAGKQDRQQPPQAAPPTPAAKDAEHDEDEDDEHGHRPAAAFVGRRPALLGRGDLRLRLIDRKSTRLNSSHVKISYAVFCLKKKRT